MNVYLCPRIIQRSCLSQTSQHLINSPPPVYSVYGSRQTEFAVRVTSLVQLSYFSGTIRQKNKNRDRNRFTKKKIKLPDTFKINGTFEGKIKGGGRKKVGKRHSVLATLKHSRLSTE